MAGTLRLIRDENSEMPEPLLSDWPQLDCPRLTGPLSSNRQIHAYLSGQAPWPVNGSRAHRHQANPRTIVRPARNFALAMPHFQSSGAIVTV